MIPAVQFLVALLQVSHVTIDTMPHAPTPSISAIGDTVALTSAARRPEVGPVIVEGEIARALAGTTDTTVVRRKKAIEYSDLYETRATIHRVASYAIIPLFAAQYIWGQKLMNENRYSSSTRNLHSLAAAGVAGLFGLNTLTGAWNLWDSRKDPAGRTRRYVHTALMLVADAGFVATGATANYSNRNLHRSLALGSMGLSVGSAAMMWFWKN